ncbi:MAG: 5-(carboxyamino)imidazole ribonucleotide mutase [Methanobacteriota archaeon]|uniref:N5-carboxyaminoimidazole ribonucleotide mutase n=1 Tax=Marine Group III euryarchaeote TaxID=2173149 RepID=A0A7C8DIQ4_9ARCH|nr:MAG: 5-(carboxyamino)imidazole ribonucleotide mutase [Euryarchaeota archaeon]HIG63646.1 5-(carboxyamino)imidazole ribonucleotide mutase [Marine Group III euryarchaeote]HIL33279.1 5-(carboxyamino)imidazole ribonucleotide mutase [Candidatus Poseidoniales archaeon]
MTSVVLLLGSASDKPVAAKAEQVLAQLGISYATHVASAHRTPRRVVELVEGSDASVFIAVAGLSAALPGVVAAHTRKPVIGVPCTSDSSPGNLDSLLSVVQMPPGVPVAAVGLGRGENAALLAARILALGDQNVATALEDYHAELERKVIESS